ncbi:MAG: DUF167 family protein [Gammaproteobacteria bacterium]|nr:DUF167 family protein [Gammaproteobacteria bacterium]
MSAHPPFHWDGGDLVLELRVQPRASADRIVGVVGDRLRVRVTAPPVDDAANRRVIALLAREFGVARSRVALIAGAASREKRVRVTAPARLPAWLEERA